MEETRVELGYLLKSYYSNTLPLLIGYCMNRVWLCKTFVVDVTCTLVVMNISKMSKCLTAATNMGCEILFCTLLK